MPSPNVDTGYGATIAWSTLTAMNNLQVADINWSGAERPAIDVTLYGSGAPSATEIGNADFIVGDVGDAGQFDIDYHFSPDKVWPLVGAADTVTITWASGATWVFSAGVTAVSGALPMRDKMVVTITVKVLGPITVTPAP